MDKDQVLAAIAAVREAHPFVGKDQSVDIDSKRTDSKRTEKYASFEHIIETIDVTMRAQGLGVAQFGRVDAGKQVLDTVIWHKPSGQSVTSSFLIEAPRPGFRDLGAMTSYLRRTATLAAFGIVARGDDPDPHAAGEIKEAKPPRVDKTARPAGVPPDARQIVERVLVELQSCTTMVHVEELSAQLRYVDANGHNKSIVPKDKADEVRKAFTLKRQEIDMAEAG